jgi:hypothetical protein
MLIRAVVTGYAFPGSGSDVTVRELDHWTRISYRQRLSGFFIEKHGTFLVRLRDDVAARLRISTGRGDIVVAGERPPRPLAISGKFALADPAGILRAAGARRYAAAGSGVPIVLDLTADRVVVQR